MGALFLTNWAGISVFSMAVYECNYREIVAPIAVYECNYLSMRWHSHIQVGMGLISI